MTPVTNPVGLVVDERWMTSRSSIVHMFTACRPPRDAQVTPSIEFPVSIVTVTGYESVHTVHRPY
jgi:hypothetical protein